LAVKKRIERDGSILIGDVLKTARIQPGDVVEIIPARNKITIKPVTPQRGKGVVREVAGKWKDRCDLVDELLRIREDECDRPGTSMD